MSKLSDENIIKSLKSSSSDQDDSNQSEFWIGLDGTKNGWSVCILDKDGKVELYFISTLNDLWLLYSQNVIHSIAIDMPLALSQKAIRGGRGCEREGRRLLTKAKQNSSIKQKGFKSQIPFVGPSSIFTPPCRIALEAFENGASHSETSEINKNSIFDSDSEQNSSNHPRKRQKKNSSRDSIGLGLSIQAYNIMPKILELDRFVSNGIQEDLFCFYPKDKSKEINSEKTFLFECHPELAFLSLSATTRKDINSLEEVRALKTKKSAIGRRERLSLLFNFPNLINKCSLIHAAATNTITDEILNRLKEDKLSFQTSWSISHISSSSSSKNKKQKDENLVSIPSDDVIDSIVCAMIAKRLSGKEEEVISITDSIDEKDSRGIPMTIFV